MADHDQQFKSLWKAFFAEFFQVFFPAWADRFDFPRVDWLEQEVFTDPPRGERRSLDLVADYRRYLLLDCLEAYATLDEAQAQELGAMLRTERYQGAQAMAMTTFEKGLQQGQRTTLQKQLKARFGPLSPSTQQRLDSLSPEQLEALALALLKARSLQELGLED